MTVWPAAFSPPAALVPADGQAPAAGPLCILAPVCPGPCPPYMPPRDLRCCLSVSGTGPSGEWAQVRICWREEWTILACMWGARVPAGQSLALPGLRFLSPRGLLGSSTHPTAGTAESRSKGALGIGLWSLWGAVNLGRGWSQSPSPLPALCTKGSPCHCLPWTCVVPVGCWAAERAWAGFLLPSSWGLEAPVGWGPSLSLGKIANCGWDVVSG